MATVVLTAVGGAIGGPVGAALGGLLGQAADARLFAGKRRDGPRLAELRVQVSSYGTEIPKLFGTMRVAGTVFWATDLVERRAGEGGGKGRPGTTRYSYLANFAVLLSARPIRRVGRVWADGRLIRGQAGDWKVRTGFRVHLGSEDQAVDPLIASAEGQAPAVRGCAYVVFEGLELAEFGERIPSLTFEVVADEGPVWVDAVVKELAPEVEAECALKLDGFAGSGGSVRAMLDVLARASGAAVAAEGGRIAMWDAPVRVIELEDAGVSADGREARRSRAVAPADIAPRVVTVAHYDPARDWQVGVQRAGRPGPGGRAEQVEMPAAMSAGAAKAMAGAMLARAEAGRVRRTLKLGLDGLGVRPGDGVRIVGEAGTWRVTAAECERLAVAVELEPLAPAPAAAAASSGRVLPAPDRVAGRTVLEAFELPGMGERLAGPRLAVAASGGAGWRGAALLHSLDDGASWVEAGATAAPAVMGVVEEALPPRGGALFDLVSAPVVRIASHMTLNDADDRALDAGANLALVGDELFQFGRAEPLGGGRWRLGRLMRGRYATEAGAAAGARFVLLAPDALRLIDLPPHAIGREMRVLASGVGDADGPAEARAALSGRSVLPLAPVHLRVAELEGGGARVSWVRRSSQGWSWIDGTDAPLGEEREAWEARVVRADGSARTVRIDSAALAVEAAERAGGPVEVLVRQIGDWGLGAAARVVVAEG